MGICTSTELLFGIFKRPLNLVHRRAEKDFTEPDPTPPSLPSPSPPKKILGKAEHVPSCMCALLVFAGGGLLKGN